MQTTSKGMTQPVFSRRSLLRRILLTIFLWRSVRRSICEIYGNDPMDLKSKQGLERLRVAIVGWYDFESCAIHIIRFYRDELESKICNLESIEEKTEKIDYFVYCLITSGYSPDGPHPPPSQIIHVEVEDDQEMEERVAQYKKDGWHVEYLDS